MGVKNLWRILAPCSKKAELEHTILAIDTSIWMHYYKTIPDNSVIFSISKRIFKLLYNKIRPIFVFDGKPPKAKERTIELRKERERKSLIRKIVLGHKCRICGEKLRMCKHINEFDKNEIKRLNNETAEKLKNHDYNWGELSDEYSREFEDLLQYDESSFSDDVQDNDKNEKLAHDTSKPLEKDISSKIGFQDNHSYVDSSIANFNYESIKDLSRQDQLERLIELRMKRKLPMQIDNSDFSSFCSSQIENVKKRNNITAMIRNLNQNERRRIKSDHTACSVFKKDEINIYKSFYSKDDESEEVVNEKSESSDLEDLFEKNKKNGWHDVFQKYDASTKDDDVNNAVIAQIDSNLSLLKSTSIKRSIFPSKVETKSQFCIKPVKNENTESSSTEESNTLDYFDILSESEINECYETVVTDSCKDFKVNAEVSNNDLQRVQNLIIEILDVFELPYIKARGEADAQCGYLFNNGIIDGVISEDNDMIIHGCTVYKNFFRKDKEIASFSYQNVYNELELDKTSLIKISYLLGSDYCLGVKSVGVKSVLKKLGDVTDSDIASLKKIYFDEDIIKISEVNFGSLSRNKLRNYLVLKGFEKCKIEELMTYCKMVFENFDVFKS
jgi:5'-3' exonuclease